MTRNTSVRPALVHLDARGHATGDREGAARDEGAYSCRAQILSRPPRPASVGSQASAPGAPTYARRGTLLVANQQSASASIIDLATGAMTLVPVGAGPHEALISPEGSGEPGSGAAGGR